MYLLILPHTRQGFFHQFGTVTHTPGIGNFSAKMTKIGNFLVLLAVLSIYVKS